MDNGGPWRLDIRAYSGGELDRDDGRQRAGVNATDVVFKLRVHGTQGPDRKDGHHHDDEGQSAKSPGQPGTHGQRIHTTVIQNRLLARRSHDVLSDARPAGPEIISARINFCPQGVHCP